MPFLFCVPSSLISGGPAFLLSPSPALLSCLPPPAPQAPIVLSWKTPVLRAQHHSPSLSPLPIPMLRFLHPLLSTISLPALFGALPSPPSLSVKCLNKLKPCFVLNQSPSSVRRLSQTRFQWCRAHSHQTKPTEVIYCR